MPKEKTLPEERHDVTTSKQVESIALQTLARYHIDVNANAEVQRLVDSLVDRYSDIMRRGTPVKESDVAFDAQLIARKITGPPAKVEGAPGDFLRAAIAEYKAKKEGKPKGEEIVFTEAENEAYRAGLASKEKKPGERPAYIVEDFGGKGKPKEVKREKIKLAEWEEPEEKKKPAEAVSPEEKRRAAAREAIARLQEQSLAAHGAPKIGGAAGSSEKLEQLVSGEGVAKMDQKGKLEGTETGTAKEEAAEVKSREVKREKVKAPAPEAVAVMVPQNRPLVGARREAPKEEQTTAEEVFPLALKAVVGVYKVGSGARLENYRTSIEDFATEYKKLDAEEKDQLNTMFKKEIVAMRKAGANMENTAYSTIPQLLDAINNNEKILGYLQNEKVVGKDKPLT